MKSGSCESNGFQMSCSEYAARPESVQSTLAVSKVASRENTAMSPAAKSKSSEAIRVLRAKQTCMTTSSRSHSVGVAKDDVQDCCDAHHVTRRINIFTTSGCLATSSLLSLTIPAYM